MKSSDKPKLIFALVVLVIAGGVIAWQMGLFGGGESSKTPPPPDPSTLKAGGAHALPGAKK
jgi:hypothetical protein